MTVTEMRNFTIGGGRKSYIAPSMRVVSLENESSILAASSHSSIDGWNDDGTDTPE